MERWLQLVLWNHKYDLFLVTWQQMVLVNLVQLNNNMMNFFTYLYYKYYRFQVKVGNGDIALFTSIMFMECILLVCYSGVLLLLGVIFPCLKSLNISVLMIVGMIVLSCILFCWCWLRVWRKKRYKEIIKYYEKTSPKSSLWAVLIPVISFLLFNAGWILMMLQNDGII